MRLKDERTGTSNRQRVIGGVNDGRRIDMQEPKGRGAAWLSQGQRHLSQGHCEIKEPSDNTEQRKSEQWIDKHNARGSTPVSNISTSCYYH